MGNQAMEQNEAYGGIANRRRWQVGKACVIAVVATLCGMVALGFGTNVQAHTSDNGSFIPRLVQFDGRSTAPDFVDVKTEVRFAEIRPAGELDPDASARTSQKEPSPSQANQYEILQLKVMKLKIGSSINFMYFTTFIGFFLILIFATMQFFGRVTDEFSKYFVVVIVIMASIMLLVMGYTEQQIAPAFGILGTILGYVFGRSDMYRLGARPKDNLDDTKPNKPEGL